MRWRPARRVADGGEVVGQVDDVGVLAAHVVVGGGGIGKGSGVAVQVGELGQALRRTCRRHAVEGGQVGAAAVCGPFLGPDDDAVARDGDDAGRDLEADERRDVVAQHVHREVLVQEGRARRACLEQVAGEVVAGEERVLVSLGEPALQHREVVRRVGGEVAVAQQEVAQIARRVEQDVVAGELRTRCPAAEAVAHARGGAAGHVEVVALALDEAEVAQREEPAGPGGLAAGVVPDQQVRLVAVLGVVDRGQGAHHEVGVVFAHGAEVREAGGVGGQGRPALLAGQHVAGLDKVVQAVARVEEAGVGQVEGPAVLDPVATRRDGRIALDVPGDEVAGLGETRRQLAVRVEQGVGPQADVQARRPQQLGAGAHHGHVHHQGVAGVVAQVLGGRDVARHVEAHGVVAEVLEVEGPRPGSRRWRGRCCGR